MNPHITELFDLKDKVALVTGGTGWLGPAMSEALAQAGATVALVGRNKAKLEKIVAQFQKNNLQAIGFTGDVMQEKTLRDCIDNVASTCRRLDILVNCAYDCPGYSIDTMTMEDYDQAFHNGPASYGIAAQQAAIHMRKIGGGSIINIGSRLGIITDVPEIFENLIEMDNTAYGSAKAAVIHLTRYMAVYWAKDNIRVNCISPGSFPDAKIQKEMPELIDRFNQRTPMARIGQPWELKGAVLFLASAASSYITGQNLLIDGGYTAW